MWRKTWWWWWNCWIEKLNTQWKFWSSWCILWRNTETHVWRVWGHDEQRPVESAPAFSVGCIHPDLRHCSREFCYETKLIYLNLEVYKYIVKLVLRFSIKRPEYFLLSYVLRWSRFSVSFISASCGSDNIEDSIGASRTGGEQVQDGGMDLARRDSCSSYNNTGAPLRLSS